MKRDYFQLFVQISQQITSTLENEEMIARCLRYLIQGLHSEAASIFLVNSQSGLTELFALSEKNENYTNIKLNRAEGIVGWVIENNQSVLVPDVTQDPRFTNRLDDMSDFVTKTILAAPLTHSGQVIGVLEILNPIDGEFTVTDLEFCESVAGQLAIVVRNIDLFRNSQNLLNQLKQLDKMKSSFISMASHELFTPLTKIKLQTQLLSDGLSGPLTKDQTAAINEIKNYTNQLTHITRDLTNMNLLESNTTVMKRFEDNLNSILLETIEETSALCKKRQLDFITHLSGNLPEIPFDRRLITVMVRNLLMNAIRFTPNKGQITLATRLAGPDIEIEIADTGVGIDPKDHLTIFQPLFEAQDISYHHSGTIEFMSGGLGLGLPIARSIALAHDGRIWVESEKDQGSRFIVSIPINQQTSE